MVLTSSKRELKRKGIKEGMRGPRDQTHAQLNHAQVESILLREPNLLKWIDLIWFNFCGIVVYKFLSAILWLYNLLMFKWTTLRTGNLVVQANQKYKFITFKIYCSNHPFQMTITDQGFLIRTDCTCTDYS